MNCKTNRGIVNLPTQKFMTHLHILNDVVIIIRFLPLGLTSKGHVERSEKRGQACCSNQKKTGKWGEGNLNFCWP